ncbi:hypothetical protein NQZ79_g3100 [Umbelopsis isabellina]|nr:hypothetical protein NQZ79_g3100 [Umbelopsis isabellina]
MATTLRPAYSVARLHTSAATRVPLFTPMNKPIAAFTIKRALSAFLPYTIRSFSTPANDDDSRPPIKRATEEAKSVITKIIGFTIYWIFDCARELSSCTWNLCSGRHNGYDSHDRAHSHASHARLIARSVNNSYDIFNRLRLWAFFGSSLYQPKLKIDIARSRAHLCLVILLLSLYIVASTSLRIRPLTSRDKSLPRFSALDESDVLKVNENSVTITEKGQKPKAFTFDCIFDASSTQQQVFDQAGCRLVDRMLNGYNATILAYGQTSSGKTYTMGTEKMSDTSQASDDGLIPRAVSYLFEKLQTEDVSRSTQPLGSAIPSFTRKASASRLRPVSTIAPTTLVSETRVKKHTIKVSFIEIYNEELIDLLNDAPPEARPAITAREDAKGQIVLHGVTELTASNLDQVLKYLELGTRNRATESTDMNEKSSRSHAIFTVILRQEKWVASSSKSATTNPRASVIEPPRSASSSSYSSRQPLNVRALIGQMEQKAVPSAQTEGEMITLQSKFHFVDLAGSERLKRTAAEGDRRKEGININAGLLALGNVISVLGDPTRKKIGAHIPYRDSKLTRLLQDSLGGNSATLMIACVSPAEYDVVETANTIKYANRARNIKNKIEKNAIEEWMQTEDVAVLRSIIAKLKRKEGTTTPPASNSTSSRSSSSPTNIMESSDSVVVSDLERKIDDLKKQLAVSQNEKEATQKELQRMRELAATEVVENDKNRKRRSDQINTIVKKRASIHISESDNFQHLVEPVIEEYEITVSKLENELSMARAALTVANDRIEEQDENMKSLHAMADEQEIAMADLQSKVQRMADKESQSENYIHELEDKLSKAADDASRDQSLLDGFKIQIAKLKEMDAGTEQYIDELEHRLSNSEVAKLNLKKEMEIMETRYKQAIASSHDSEGNASTDLAREIEERDAAYSILQKEKEDLEQQLHELQLNNSSRPQSTSDGQWTPRASEDEFNLGTDEALDTSEADDKPMSDISLDALQRRHMELKTAHDQVLDDLTKRTSQYNDALTEIQALKDVVSHKPDDMVLDAESERDSGITITDNLDIAEVERERDELKQQVELLQTKIQELEADISGMCEKEFDRVTVHMKDMEGLQSILTETKLELATTNDQLVALQSASKDHERHQEEMAKHIEALHSKELALTELQSTIRSKESLISELQTEVTSHLEELSAATSQIHKFDNLRVQHTELQSKHEQALLQKSALEETHQSLALDATRLQNAHDSAQASVELLKQELDQMHELQAKKVQDLKAAQWTIEELKLQMSEYEQGTQMTLAARLEELEKVKLDLQAVTLVEEKQDAVIQGLESQVNEMSERAVEMRKHLHDREQTIETLETSLASKINEVNNMRIEVETVRRDLVDIHKERRQLYLVISQMEGSLRKQDDKTDKTRENLEDLKRQYELQADDLEVKRLSLESLESEKQELAKSLRAIIDRASAGDEVSAALERQLEFANKNLAEKLFIIEQHERTISQLKSEQIIVSNLIVDLEKNSILLEQCSHKNEEITASLQAANEKFQALDVEHKALVADMAEKTAHNERLEGVNSVLQMTVDGLELQVSLSSGDEESDVQEKVRILNESHRQTEKEMQDRLDRAMKDVDEHKARLAKQEQSTNELTASVQSLQSQLEVAIESKSQLNSKIESLQAQIDELLKEQTVAQLAIKSKRTRHGSDSEQLVEENSELMGRISELELEIKLEREKSIIESKTLQTEIEKLSVANDQLEHEMEQLVPQATMNFVNKRSSIASNVSLSALMQTMTTASKSSKIDTNQQGKLSSVPEDNMSRDFDSDNELASKRNSIVSIASSSRGSVLSTASVLPPRSAPPSVGLPPIPGTIPAPPSTPPNAPLPPRPTSPPVSVRRNGSDNSSINGSINSTILQTASISTADQFEKTVRALQRKLNVSENDVKAHQDVINKLEVQLTRAEASVRENRKQLDSMNRERSSATSELDNLRAEVSNLRGKILKAEEIKAEERAALQKQLDNERRYKEKAERARVILENRMEELMSKKNKFICF